MEMILCRMSIKHCPEYPGIVYMWPGAFVCHLARAHVLHKKLQSLLHVRACNVAYAMSLF